MNRKNLIIPVIIAILVIALDQITKVMAVNYLTTLPYETHTLIEGILELKYVKNFGMAWGMMQGARWIFIAITIIVCSLMVYFVIKKISAMDKCMLYGLTLVFAGAIGNLIDRLFLEGGFVRDMIYVKAIDFPVFNVADSAVTIGAVLIFISILFMHGYERVFPEKKTTVAKDE